MLKAAVIGLGWWGKQITAYLSTSQHIQVTHGVDVNLDVLADFASQHNVKLLGSLAAVLEDSSVDAVILVTPHSLHEEQAMQVIAAGKQLFCEKPLALTGAGAERILAACQKAGIVLGIGHERRFETGMEEALAALRSGSIGQLLHMEANVSHNLFAKADPSSWRVQKKDAPAGAMTALGVHLTDLFISFAGKPTHVRAKTGRVLKNAVGDDQVFIQLDFPDGVTGSVTCLSTTPYHGHLTLFGSTGWIEVRENGNVDWGRPSDVTVSDSMANRTVKSYPSSNVVLKNFDAWACAVAGEAPYRYTTQQILDNVKVLEAVVRSSSNASELIAIG
jgi:predicted dehydrogenase